MRVEPGTRVAEVEDTNRPDRYWLESEDAPGEDRHYLEWMPGRWMREGGGHLWE